MFLFLFVFCYHFAYCQWNPLDGYLDIGYEEVFNGGIDFDISPDNGIYVSSGYWKSGSPHYYWYKVTKSSDRGNSWSVIAFHNFTSSSVIRCMGNSKFIEALAKQVSSWFYVSTDDGLTWSALGGYHTDGYFSDFAFSDLENGIAVVYYAPPKICRISNGNWVCTSVDTLEFNKAHLQMIDNNTAYLLCRDSVAGMYSPLGNNTLLKTTDAGISWSMFYKDTTYQINHFCFTSASDAMMVGDNGKIYQTTDGGITWASMESGTDKRISFITSKDGTYFCVGDSGLILSLAPGTNTWNDLSFGTSNYYKIKFDNDFFGYILTSDHTILKSEQALGQQDNAAKPAITLYPNPCSDEITISYPGAMKPDQLIIANSLGQVVYSGHEPADGKLNVSNLTAGCYVVSLISGEQVLFRKLIKQ